MRATAVILVFCSLLVNTAQAQSRLQIDAELCVEGTGVDLLDIEICGRAIRAAEAAGLSALSRATLYSARGRAHTARAAFTLAIADFDAALQLNPASASAYNYRGVARHGLSQWQLAIADYGQAIALFPHYAEAIRNRGRSYLLLGDSARAIADCNQAIALNAADPEPFVNRGLARYSRGLYSLAVDDFAQLDALQYPYQYQAVWHYLAQAHAQRDARSELAAAAGQLDPGEWPQPLLAVYLGTVTAEVALDAAQTAPPEVRPRRLSEARFYLGELALLRGDEQRAAVLLRKSLAGGFMQSIEHRMAQSALSRIAR